MNALSLEKSGYLDTARDQLTKLMQEKHLDNKLRPLTQSEIISANRKLADMKNPLGAVARRFGDFFGKLQARATLKK